MLFEPIDFSKLNEQDVREEILAPIIRHLGYRRGTSNDVIREKSSEDILSCDSEKPTLFVSRKTYTIPQGETALNITTGKTTLLPYTVKADISINARAVLSAKKLSGQFTCEYNFHQSTSSLSLVGEFELNLS